MKFIKENKGIFEENSRKLFFKSPIDNVFLWIIETICIYFNMADFGCPGVYLQDIFYFNNWVEI